MKKPTSVRADYGEFVRCCERRGRELTPKERRQTQSRKKGREAVEKLIVKPCEKFVVYL